MENAEATLTFNLENVNLPTRPQATTTSSKSIIDLNLKVLALLLHQELTELPYFLQVANSVVLVTQDFHTHPLLETSKLVLMLATKKKAVSSSITTPMMASVSEATLVLLTALKA